MTISVILVVGVLTALPCIHQAKAQPVQWLLVPAEGVQGFSYGSALAIDSNRVLIGHPYSSAVYLFEWNDNAWVESTKLLPADASDNHFGSAVAIHGNRAVIGAASDDVNGPGSGSAYVFEWDGSAWSQTAKLLPQDGADYREFAGAVAFDGNRIIVGSPQGFTPPGVIPHFSSYIFEWDGSMWVQTAKLLPDTSDVPTYFSFGRSVALDGDRAFVGAPGDNRTEASGGLGSGAVYVFEWNGDAWIKTNKLLPEDATGGEYFGASISLDGHRLLVGADGQTGKGTGAAYVFEWDGTGWVQTAKLTSGEGASYDGFGGSVALGGKHAFAGAEHDDVNGQASGSVYVFELDGNAWTRTSKLLPDDGGSRKRFGFSVAVDGTRTVVGNGSGSAYLFDFTAAAGTGIDRDGIPAQAGFALHPSYPNPFNSSTRIAFDVPESVHVRLIVYDVLGREVTRLVDRVLPRGRHEYTWNANGRASGPYLLRMEAGSFVTSQPVVLMR